MKDDVGLVQNTEYCVFGCVGHVIVSLREAGVSPDMLAKFVFELYRLYTRQYHIVIVQHPGSALNLSYIGEFSDLGIPVEVRIHASATDATMSLPPHRAKIDVLLMEHEFDQLERTMMETPDKPIRFWEISTEKGFGGRQCVAHVKLPEGISPKLRELIQEIDCPILDLEKVVIDEGDAGVRIDPLEVLNDDKGLITSNCSSIGGRFAELIHMATLRELPFNLNACVGGSAPICELMSTARLHGKIKCVEAVLDSSWSETVGEGHGRDVNHRRSLLRGQFDLMSCLAFGTTIGSSEGQRIHPDTLTFHNRTAEAGLEREVLRMELSSYGPSAIIEMTSRAHHPELHTLNPGQTGIFVTVDSGPRWGAYGSDLGDKGRRLNLLTQLVDRKCF